MHHGPARFLLARALREHPGDLDAAYAAYETLQRPYVHAAQASVTPHLDMMVPATWDAIESRNARLRAANNNGNSNISEERS